MAPDAAPITDSLFFASAKSPGVTQLENLSSKLNEVINRVSSALDAKFSQQVVVTLSDADRLLKCVYR